MEQTAFLNVRISFAVELNILLSIQGQEVDVDWRKRGERDVCERTGGRQVEGLTMSRRARCEGARVWWAITGPGVNR
jgi:hypothetical protein